MTELSPEEASGGTASPNHAVLKVLLISMSLAAIAGFVLEITWS